MTDYLPNGRCQGHATRFKVLRQSYLWNWWSQAFQILRAVLYIGVLEHVSYIIPKQMGSESRDLKFWEIIDNISLKDRDGM